MEYVTLPKSELKVSPVCLGCWQFNNGVQSNDKTWNAMPIETSKSIVDKAIELGINFFDTAEGYLNSEEVMGKMLAGRRKNVVLASKMGARVKEYTAEDVEISLTRSLQRLQTDYLDLYQVHWPNFMSDYKEVFDELKRQQAKGRIRYYSVCNFGPQNMKDALAVGAQPITNQVSYSLLWRAVEYEILPMCRENDIGILPYSPLQQGLLGGKFRKLEDVPEGRRRTRLFNSQSTELSRHGGEGAETLMFQTISNIAQVCEDAGITMPEAALSWLLQQDTVKSVIVGASSPEQVERNVKQVALQQNVIAKLEDATKELKEVFSNSPDLWMPESRIN